MSRRAPRTDPKRPARRQRSWTWRLGRNLLFTAPLAMVVWLLISPYLSLFLSKAAERLTRLGERPATTRIELSKGEDALLTRGDTRAHGRLPYAIRVTDIHFPLVLLIAIFLATPGVTTAERFANLGYALLITLCFQVIDLFFWVKFAYATQLGEWSTAHYGPLARNFWGLGKHILDLPVKLALPFALWVAIYLRQLTGEIFGQADS